MILTYSFQNTKILWLLTMNSPTFHTNVKAFIAVENGVFPVDFGALPARWRCVCMTSVLVRMSSVPELVEWLVGRFGPTVDGSEISNNHVECIKPRKWWDKLPTSPGFLAGFFASTVRLEDSAVVFFLINRLPRVVSDLGKKHGGNLFLKAKWIVKENPRSVHSTMSGSLDHFIGLLFLSLLSVHQINHLFSPLLRKGFQFDQHILQNGGLTTNWLKKSNHSQVILLANSLVVSPTNMIFEEFFALL